MVTCLLFFSSQREDVVLTLQCERQGYCSHLALYWYELFVVSVIYNMSVLLLAAPCCNVKHLFYFSSLCDTHLMVPLHCSVGLWFLYVFICVWECVWQEFRPPPLLVRQAAESWTPNRTMNRSRVANSCHTSARRASMPLVQQQQVGQLLPSSSALILPLNHILRIKSVLNFMAIHPIVVETFHSKPQMWTSCWHQRKSQGITKVMRIYPLGNLNICSK